MGKIPENKDRDDELIRRILLDVQSSPMQSPGRQIYIDAVAALTISEHLVLLQQHRLLECLVIRENNGMLREALAKQITAEGREFLRGAESVPAWKKTMAQSRTASFASFIRTLKKLTLEADEEGEEIPDK